MGHTGTDTDWQRWGEQNPYFGVLADPQYLNANLTSDSIQKFFATGEQHVEHVLSVIRNTISPDFKPSRVLDYGCGTGRLVVPFASHSKEVVGIDVSPGMLAQASENCRKFGVTNARLLSLEEMDSLEASSFDLVHSYIVFQHIPVARGELIVKKLITLLAEGGAGALHFNYSDTRQPMLRAISALRQRVPFAHGVLNLLQHRAFSTPLMQMNRYSVNRILDILFDLHCSNVHLELSDHGGFHTVMFYFKK
jgi:ubiquinone/menaquinone biosynthesis C-methylase UbiE